jgi:hypothetical protein
MYTQYYLQARDAADKIRQGQFAVPKTEQPAGGFIPRRSPSMEQQLEAARPDPQELVLKYMQGVQDSVMPNYDIAAGPTSKALEALAAVESGGRYDALGPVMETGSYRGDRAYGKYQVMGKNIPSWTKEALGTSMTPDEFLANTDAQDAVAAHFMQKSYQKYGTWEDAASVWFTGRPLAQAGNASDGYTSVQDYVAKFQRGMA